MGWDREKTTKVRGTDEEETRLRMATEGDENDAEGGGREEGKSGKRSEAGGKPDCSSAGQIRCPRNRPVGRPEASKEPEEMKRRFFKLVREEEVGG